MDRDVKIGDKEYKIRIGFGVYQRIDALSVFIRVTTVRPTDGEDLPLTEKEQHEQKVENLDAAKAALVSEDIMTPTEAKEILPASLAETNAFIELIDAEQKLSERMRETKIRVIELAVRNKAGVPLAREYIETGLDPSDGEELFVQVMETFDLLRQQIEDGERRKKS